MRLPRLHHWPRTPARAIALQCRLRDRVILCAVEESPRYVAGADMSVSPDGAALVAGVVVWDTVERRAVESRVVRTACRFPYVPGLLSFREAPGVLAALRGIRTHVDALMCDGAGLAHPRRFGLACHLGLWAGIPTIGAAKSRLCGEHAEPGAARGCAATLTLNGRTVGLVLRTRDAVRPLFVSPGHLCDVETSARTVLQCAVRYRLPEPTRLAHQLVTCARARLH